MSDGMSIKLAEYIEEAMREIGAMPRWKLSVDAPPPPPRETVATLQLAPDLVLHVRECSGGIGASVSITGIRDTDFDAVLSKLPGKLAPKFEAAAAELRRLDSMTPRGDSAEEGGAE
ncbi:MAG: hypothetical protein JW741_17370 [Sedimentisphaerales bacterium]|nr:hypothetical protein [Sedimentisphaerales bacterium]